MRRSTGRQAKRLLNVGGNVAGRLQTLNRSPLTDARWAFSTDHAEQILTLSAHPGPIAGARKGVPRTSHKRV